MITDLLSINIDASTTAPPSEIASRLRAEVAQARWFTPAWVRWGGRIDETGLALDARLPWHGLGIGCRVTGVLSQRRGVTLFHGEIRPTLLQLGGSAFGLIGGLIMLGTGERMPGFPLFGFGAFLLLDAWATTRCVARRLQRILTGGIPTGAAA